VLVELPTFPLSGRSGEHHVRRALESAAGGQACYSYCDNYLIDVGHAVMVDVESATVVRQAEVGTAQTMLTCTAGHPSAASARRSRM
jgi:hypothetical protein